MDSHPVFTDRTPRTEDGSESVAVMSEASQVGLLDAAADPEQVKQLKDHRTQQREQRPETSPLITAAEAVDDTIAVRAPTLYTQLLDACDWTEYIAAQERAEKAARERAAFRENERKERAQRALLKEKSLQDARAMMEAKKRHAAAAKEARQTREFEERNLNFFQRQRAIHAAMVPLEYDRVQHKNRVRHHLYEKWENEVFLPIQNAINEKIDGEDVLVDATAVVGAHRGNISGHLATTLSTTLAGSAASASAGLVTVNTAEVRREALKQQRREAYLRESAKKERGLFLDTVDETEYDPVGQRKQATIRYTVDGSSHCKGNRSGNGPHSPSNRRWGSAKAKGASGRAQGKSSKRENDAYFTVQQKEADEQAIKQGYVQLALAYREEELQSRTGALRAPANESSVRPHTNPHNGSCSMNGKVGRRAPKASLSWAMADSVVHRTETPTPPPPAAFTAIRNGDPARAVPPPRRTHLPFNLDPSAGPAPTRRDHISPFPFATFSRPAASAAPTSATYASADATIATTAAGAPRLTGSQHVMPLPLIEGKRDEQQRRSKECLLACFGCPVGTLGEGGASALSHRERALPIAQWDHQKLKDTHYARYVEEDGEGKREFCERKRWEGEMMLDEQIRLM